MRATAEKAWTQAWKDLEQEKIQSWIERIPRHIQKVIKLKGGNKYKEGRQDTPLDRKQRKQAI